MTFTLINISVNRLYTQSYQTRETIAELSLLEIVVMPILLLFFSGYIVSNSNKQVVTKEVNLVCNSVIVYCIKHF